MKGLQATFLSIVLSISFVGLSCTSTVELQEQNQKLSAVEEKPPLVFVHGVLGFEPDSLINLPYWGGTVDLEAELRKSGIPTYTAPVGPVSSNWDRACELYAFLKGGRVDYGAVHAERYGHARYGRSYPGVYPEWGSIDPQSGNVRRIHLIGHSMGGQTARLLVQLLEQGDPEERKANLEDLSPLFAGGKDWVRSVSTLSSPHDGTTLTFRYEDVGLLQKLLVRQVAVGSLRKEDPLLDLQLEHWKSAARKGESLEGFLKRAIQQNLWRQTKDFCYYDLTPQGAAELNRRTAASRNVYYFTWATSRTRAEGQKGYHVPMQGMNLPLHPTAKYMGSLEDLPRICGDDPSLWWENDGEVNTCSMDGPTLSSDDTIVQYRKKGGDPEKGVWNYMGLLRPLDHWQIILVPPIGADKPPGFDSLRDFYLRWADFLYALPE